MADEVKVPLAGKQSKKTVVLVAVGAGVFVLYMYMRRSKSATAASVSAPIDSATGYPSGSPQDLAALAAQSGSGTSSNLDPATGAVYGSPADLQALGAATTSYPAQGYYGSSAVTGNTIPTTNAEWAQSCEATVPQLVNSPTAQADVASAIGRFLARLPLTTDQANIIQVCESEFGPPPVGNYSIIPQASTTPPGSGTPTPIAVPNTIGSSAGSAHNAIINAGLIPTAPHGQTPNMKVSRTDPPGGTQVAKGTHVAIFTHGYV
jgi:hypothetical protein